MSEALPWSECTPMLCGTNRGVCSPLHLLPCPPFRKSACDGKVLMVDLGRSCISASETLDIPAQPNKNI